MRKFITIIARLMATATGIGAQETTTTARRWHFEVDLRYQHMVFHNTTGRTKIHFYDTEKQAYIDYDYKNNNHQIIGDQGFPDKYGGNTLVLMETFDINRRLTVGLGLTLARYNQMDESGGNLVASLRYKPWSQHPYGYFYTELGLGPLVNLGWGTSVRLSKRRRLAFKVGYNMQCINSYLKLNSTNSEGYENYYNSHLHSYMHCLQGSIGIVF